MELTAQMEIAAAVIACVGVWYVGTPRLFGVWLMFVAQVIWLPYAFMTKQYFLAIQCLALFILNIRCIKRWKNQNIGEQYATNRMCEGQKAENTNQLRKL